MWQSCRCMHSPRRLTTFIVYFPFAIWMHCKKSIIICSPSCIFIVIGNRHNLSSLIFVFTSEMPVLLSRLLLKSMSPSVAFIREMVTKCKYVHSTFPDCWILDCCILGIDSRAYWIFIRSWILEDECTTSFVYLHSPHAHKISSMTFITISTNIIEKSFYCV